MAQSFDSNVNLTPTNQIADFYFTPRAGLEFQLGTPDSQRITMFDTILGVHGSYEAYADLFYANPGLSAFNQRLDLSARIGRSAAIWRPFIQASDLTGSNLLINEFVNRTRRIKVLPGLNAEYKLTELTGWNQTFVYSLFQHPDPQYINFNTWGTSQEITHFFLNPIKTILWTEYRFTQPDRGSAGQEFFVGLGWDGRPDPRVYTQMRFGWDFLDMEGYVPNRQDMSGIRFHGYTTFDWGPRFRLNLNYDRDYVFNETQEDNNYVATLLQLIGDFYLGDNWYIRPYLGIATLEYETSRALALQTRPEIEISYAFPNRWYPEEAKPQEPRVFVKFGYNRLDYLKGEGEVIQGLRVSVGANLKF